MKLIAPALAGVVAAFAVTAMPALAQADRMDKSGLAAETLADGQSAQAIALINAALESQPNDPALLINLGIAQAQAGLEAQARASFEAARDGREVVDLETANGGSMDSRRLARRAIAMLDRGEFRPAQRTDQLTLRD